MKTAIALALGLILVGCSSESESPNIEQDSEMATGTTGGKVDPGDPPAGAPGPNDSGWDGKTEDGAKPPSGG